MSENDAASFFCAQRAAFAQTLQSHPGVAGVDAALANAWDSFERNVDIQSEGHPPVACGKGCSACCTLRVTATAPEVFTIAAFLRQTAPTLQAHGIDLPARVHEAHASTAGLGAAERVALRRRCAFVERGVCLIHRVRPLSCRGHCSHDRMACAEAAAGRRDEVPYSGPHRVVRMLVQSALQAALRDQGLAWAAYELNHALALALGSDRSAAAWLAGQDPLAPAAADLDLREAMAAEFDDLRRHTDSAAP